MAISSDLHKAILEAAGLSTSGLSRLAKRVQRDHGPMSADEARGIIAHESGVDLKRYWTTDEIERVRQLRAGGATSQAASARDAAKKTAAGSQKNEPSASEHRSRPSRADIFASRDFHVEVKGGSEKLFCNQHRGDCVQRAFKRIENRVRELVGSEIPRKRRGQSLIGHAFDEHNPLLQATDLATESDRNEQVGMRLLLMGSIAALRNPLAHDDKWLWDGDDARTLECLALASLLHYFLDRCESYREAHALTGAPAI